MQKEEAPFEIHHSLCDIRYSKTLRSGLITARLRRSIADPTRNEQGSQTLLLSVCHTAGLVARSFIRVIGR